MEPEAAAQKKGLLKKVSKSLKKAKKTLRKSLSSRKSLSRSNSVTGTFSADAPGTARATKDGERGSEFSVRRSFSESDSRPRERKSTFLQDLAEDTGPSRRPGSFRYEDVWTEADTVDSMVDSPHATTVSSGSKLFHSVDSATPSPREDSMRQRAAMPGSLLAERRKNSGEGRSSFSEEARDVEEKPMVVSPRENEKPTRLGSKVVQVSVAVADGGSGVTVKMESVAPVVEHAPKVVPAEVVADTENVVKEYQDSAHDAEEDTNEQETKAPTDASETADDEKVTEKQTEELENIPAVCEKSVAAVDNMSNGTDPVVAVAPSDSEATVEKSTGAAIVKKDGETTEELFSRLGKQVTLGGSGSKLGNEVEKVVNESVPLDAAEVDETSENKLDVEVAREAAPIGSVIVDALPVDVPGLGTVSDEVGKGEKVETERATATTLEAVTKEAGAVDSSAPEQVVAEEMDKVFELAKEAASVDALLAETISDVVKEAEGVSAAVEESVPVDVPEVIADKFADKMEAAETQAAPELNVESLKEAVEEAVKESAPAPVDVAADAVVPGADSLPVVKAEIEQPDAVTPPEEVVAAGEKDSEEKSDQNNAHTPPEAAVTGAADVLEDEKMEKNDVVSDEAAVDAHALPEAAVTGAADVLEDEKMEKNDAVSDEAAVENPAGEAIVKKDGKTTEELFSHISKQVTLGGSGSNLGNEVEKVVIAEETETPAAQTGPEEEKLVDEGVEPVEEEEDEGPTESPADSEEESFSKESELDVIPEGRPLEQPALELVDSTPQTDESTVVEGAPSNAVATGDVAEEETLGVDVKSKQTREFSLADVEAAKAKRNSCSQVDEASRVRVAQSGTARHSADVSDFQIQEQAAEGGGEGRKRWRWVRRVVAPVTVLTGALLITISKAH